MTNSLLNNVYTKQQADEVLAEMEEAERNSFRAGYKNQPQKATPYEAKKLKEELAELVVLNLTTAIKPSDDFLARVCRWTREKIDQKVILNITVDPSIVAGAIVSFKGQYKDLSVGKKIEKWMKNKLII